MRPEIRQTIDRLERFMSTVDDALALPRDAAEFVHALLLATGARRAVEIGTSYGYSGLWIASALEKAHGRLITIDKDPRKIDAAKSNFGAAGLDSCVDFRTGIALEILPQIDGPIDFVLNDADKDHCIRYIELLDANLADRAVVLTDNTGTHPAELADFLAWIRGRPDYRSCQVPIGNGMELSVKIGDDSGRNL